MGADELYDGIGCGAAVSQDIAIALPDRAKRQLTIMEAFDRSVRARR